MGERSLRVIDGGEATTVVREFFRVARLVPDDQELVALPPGATVRQALSLMDEHGFSQLPVVAGGTVVGVFTYRSLARNLKSIRRQDDPLDAPVDDLVEDLSFVRASDEVGEILGRLDRDGAVLIGDETNLLAVATTSDVINFLWEATRAFVLVQDVELAVRDLMRAACPAPEELAARIALGFSSDRRQELPAGLDELTLGELLGVILQGENFGQCFNRTFGHNRDLVRGQLEPVRDIRNKVVHFRDDVSADELSTLVATRKWLLRKVLTVRSSFQ
jgi:CBS domain-containing protein